MTNGEKHIEKLLSWYKEAVTEDGVCYLTCDDKNTLAYALKCCKHFEDIKKDIDSWGLREELSSSEIPNKSEIPTGSTTKNDLGVDCISRDGAIKALDYDIKYFEFKSGVSKHMDDIAKLLNTIYETQVNNIKALPSVTQIRPKGHWIWVFDETPSTPISPYEVNYAGWVCSCCNKFPDDICEWDDPNEPPTYKFCPNCGSDNREVVE